MLLNKKNGKIQISYFFFVEKKKRKKGNWKMLQNFSNFSETKENKIWEYSWILWVLVWVEDLLKNANLNLNLNFQRWRKISK